MIRSEVPRSIDDKCFFIMTNILPDKLAVANLSFFNNVRFSANKGNYICFSKFHNTQITIFSLQKNRELLRKIITFRYNGNTAQKKTGTIQKEMFLLTCIIKFLL